jgi:hypothetical protein
LRLKKSVCLRTFERINKGFIRQNYLSMLYFRGIGVIGIRLIFLDTGSAKKIHEIYISKHLRKIF